MRRILALLLLMTAAAAHADVGGYRVEVILFQNLQANLDPVEVDSLRSYSNVPALTESSLPDDLTALTVKSERMEGVWHRLRNSKGYRPLVYSSWIQNNIDYYPPLRIHDEVVVDSQIRPPTNIVVTDLQSRDPLQAFRSIFYQLDGSVQLRISRFLHINIDLEYRVPARNVNHAQGTAFSSQISSGDRMSEDNTLGNGGNHDVYRLKQSRQVKTDRLQYFDSPWFGALILVIPIAAEPQLQEQTANNGQ